jgi:hypothetical protein
MGARKRLIPARPAQHQIRHAETCTKGPPDGLSPAIHPAFSLITTTTLTTPPPAFIGGAEEDPSRVSVMCIRE